jgi:hypothetical protein
MTIVAVGGTVGRFGLLKDGFQEFQQVFRNGGMLLQWWCPICCIGDTLTATATASGRFGLAGVQ